MEDNPFLSLPVSSGSSPANAQVDNPFLSLPDASNQPSQIMAGVRSFNTGVERFTHGTLQPLLEGGLLGDNVKRGSQQVAKDREAQFQEDAKNYPKTSNIASLIGNVGATIPLAAIPGLGESALARGVTSSAIQGGLMGAGQYVNNNDLMSRLGNTGIGAGIGSAAPLLTRGAFASNPLLRTASSVGLGAGIGAGGAGLLGINPIMGALAGGTNGAGVPITKFAHDMFFPKNKIMGQVANAVSDVPQMIATKQAGNRIGTHLTPAEASGNELLAQMQGNLGKSEAGAKILQQFGNEHVAQQKAAINGLFQDISPNSESAATDVRASAQKIIQNEQDALASKARPLYESSASHTVSPDDMQVLMKDPIIADAFTQVSKNKVWSKDLQGVSPNSIKYLDYVKKYIDDKASSNINSGNRNAARLLTGSKNDLTKITDIASPDYAAARAIYGEGAQPLQALKESNLGRIADLPDQQLKNVSKIIFDPAQTDPKVLIQMRDKINNQNPDAWRQITRNEMERTLDNTQGTGVNFYSKILNSDRKFNQFLNATQKIPGATQKLTDMRAVFKNIINPTNARGAAKLSNTSMLGRRDAAKTVKDFVTNVMGGRYDQEFVKFITNPNWDKELTNYMKKPTVNLYDKALKYQSILTRIGTAIGVAPSNQ